MVHRMIEDKMLQRKWLIEKCQQSIDKMDINEMTVDKMTRWKE